MNSAEYGFGRDATGRATLGGRPLTDLISEANVTTPAYFYDLSAISHRIERIESALQGAPHLVAYALKANSAATILKSIVEAGAGVDVVSGGELLLARRVGVTPRKIVLSGVAKRDDEIDLALSENILAIQVESLTELTRVAERARVSGQQARVSIRINPSVEIDSHAHISTGHDAAKFGVAQSDLEEALAFVRSAGRELSLVGLSTHVGSMLRSPEAYLRSARVVCEHAGRARKAGFALEYVDFGGGFGIDYGQGSTTPPEDFAASALTLQKEQGLGDLMLVIEPGRSIVGSFGVLVAQVVQAKASGARRWLMIDAGMNDLLRPALYQAHHRIEPIDQPPSELTYRVVGPVCESTDDFGEHPLGDVPTFVVVRDAGAYGFTMASEYNGRPLPAEVFVQAGRVVHRSESPGVEAWVEARLRA
jgi:diaminopimelate decarboxylase